jgi:DNA replication protein DnaC
MHTLPPVNHRWVLEEPESVLLAQQFPDLWSDPSKSCITCLFHRSPDQSKTFRWYNADHSEVVDWACNCADQWRLHRWLLQHGIGKAYQRLGWMDAIDVPSAVQAAALDYVENSAWYVERGMNIILNSPDAGSGKTLTLMLMAKELLDVGVDVYVAQMNSIVEMYTSGWRSAELKAYFEQRIMNCGVLVIDDLGKERGENRIDFIDKLVDRVFRHRIAAAKPLLISSNLTKEQIAAAYTSYVASLLTETTTFIDASGRDWRPRVQVRMVEEIRLRLSRPVVIR